MRTRAYGAVRNGPLERVPIPIGSYHSVCRCSCTHRETRSTSEICCSL